MGILRDWNKLYLLRRTVRDQENTIQANQKNKNKFLGGIFYILCGIMRICEIMRNMVDYADPHPRILPVSLNSTYW